MNKNNFNNYRHEMLGYLGDMIDHFPQVQLLRNPNKIVRVVKVPVQVRERGKAPRPKMVRNQKGKYVPELKVKKLMGDPNMGKLQILYHVANIMTEMFKQYGSSPEIMHNEYFSQLVSLHNLLTVWQEITDWNIQMDVANMGDRQRRLHEGMIAAGHEGYIKQLLGELRNIPKPPSVNNPDYERIMAKRVDKFNKLIYEHKKQVLDIQRKAGKPLDDRRVRRPEYYHILNEIKEEYEPIQKMINALYIEKNDEIKQKYYNALVELHGGVDRLPGFKPYDIVDRMGPNGNQTRRAQNIATIIRDGYSLSTALDINEREKEAIQKVAIQEELGMLKPIVEDRKNALLAEGIWAEKNMNKKKAQNMDDVRRLIQMAKQNESSRGTVTAHHSAAAIESVSESVGVATKVLRTHGADKGFREMTRGLVEREKSRLQELEYKDPSFNVPDYVQPEDPDEVEYDVEKELRELVVHSGPVVPEQRSQDLYLRLAALNEVDFAVPPPTPASRAPSMPASLAPPSTVSFPSIPREDPAPRRGPPRRGPRMPGLY